MLAPILAAVFVNYRGRKAGIMLGCVLMMIGQVRVWEQHDRTGLGLAAHATQAGAALLRCTALHQLLCSSLQQSINLLVGLC